MTKSKRIIAILAGTLALSACASGSAGSRASSAQSQPAIPTVPTAQAKTPAKVTVRAPRKSDVASIIGEEASALAKRFGTARIDLQEGTARKLQFGGERCVLDIYLYPVAAGTAPVATHVEARLRADGSDVEKAGCIAEIARN